MKRELGKVLRKRFGEELRRRLPQFREAKCDRSSGTYNLYEWIAAAGLHIYLVLQIHTRDDRFTIELSWSRHGRFPEHLGLLYPRDLPVSRISRDRPKDGEFRFRLPYLYALKDVWWELNPTPTLEQILEQQRALTEGGGVPDASIQAGLDRVDPCVQDAVDQILEHGLPFVMTESAAE